MSAKNFRNRWSSDKAVAKIKADLPVYMMKFVTALLIKME